MMPADLLNFPAGADDVAIEPQPSEPLIEPDEPAIEPDEPAAIVEHGSSLPAAPLAELMPPGFKLPALIHFVPNPALRIAADQQATYALTLDVTGPEGLQRADLALTTLRGSLKAIEDVFAEPGALANELHKNITARRAEWLSRGKQAIEQVGRRIYDEQRRLEAIAAEERRKAQAEADRQAREAAAREAEAAAKQQAPAAVVEELKRQAETATAPPVSTPAAVAPPALKGSTTVTTWKARIVGTSGSDEPNPEMANLSPAQRGEVFKLLRAILDGAAPLALLELNWSAINARAKAEKSAFAIPGFEAFEVGSVRAKGTRTR